MFVGFLDVSLMAVSQLHTFLEFDYEMTWVHTGFSKHCIGYYTVTIAPISLFSY